MPSSSRTRAIVKRLIGYPVFIVLAFALLWVVSIRMPGETFTGPLPALTAAESASAHRLRADVEVLAGAIGERNQTRIASLDSAARFIETTFRTLGYTIEIQSYRANTGARNIPFRNIEATLRGAGHPGEIVLIGAHYDSVIESPGADDNASGTSSLLEIAQLVANEHPDRTVRFVAFANEEPPLFWTEDMGSLRYARMAKARGDSIVAMLSLESLGYYSVAEGSQRYPLFLHWFYPNRGDFIAFVGNLGSRSLVRRVVRDFRSHTQFPSQGTAAPKQIPGIGWSDHWSFWQVGYAGIMITGTAPNRNANYHTPEDLPATLDYDRMARVVHGVTRVVRTLANH